MTVCAVWHPVALAARSSNRDAYLPALAGYTRAGRARGPLRDATALAICLLVGWGR
jgi:hypothetical protein